MDEKLSTLDALAQLSFVMHARLEQSAARADVSVTQMRLLGILADREPTVSELAERLSLSKSSVSGLIDRAVRRGLVSRAAEGEDGRVVRVRIEPEGRSVLERAGAVFTEQLGGVLDVLDRAERASWVALTRRMLEAEASV